MGIAVNNTITSQPTNQATTTGGTVTFSVTATGATTYQWQYFSGGIWNNVSTGSGGTTASWTTAALTTSDSSTPIQCVIT